MERSFAFVRAETNLMDAIQDLVVEAQRMTEKQNVLTAQIEVVGAMATSITDVSEYPGPHARAQFLSRIDALATEQECQRVYFWLHDWALEIEAAAKACAERSVYLRTRSLQCDPVDPRR